MRPSKSSPRVLVALFTLLLLPIAPALAQVCSTGADGVITVTNPQIRVNVYYPAPDPAITTSVAAGATSIPVDPAGGQATNLLPGLSTSIAAGDVLLVMQMQGADIDTSDNHLAAGNYGDGAGGLVQAGTLNNANYTVGVYEFVIATGPLAGGNIPIQGKGTGNGLLNAYVTSNDTTGNTGFRRYQVVKVPQFAELTVTGEIVSDRWNGRWGGISALNVRNAMNVDGGSFNADGRGFRGGQFSPFVATAAGGNFGYKGEGIAGTPSRMYSRVLDLEDGAGGDGEEVIAASGYPGADGGGPGTSAWTRDSGLGAAGNAGSGGGNDEDAGGGGGGNFGRGGAGGEGNAGAAPGIGGAGFPEHFARGAGRLVMGGGGGASNGDDIASLDLSVSSGQSGGGIVFIRALDIDTSGGGTISALGDSGGTAASEGGGGGGAGGTVLIHTDNDSVDGLSFSVQGGTGGSSLLMNDGGGGGGSAGVILLSDTVPGSATFNVAGGAAGTGLSGAMSPQFNGQPGAAGLQETIAPIDEFDCDFINLGIAKSVTSVSRIGVTSVYDVTFQIVVENLSTTTDAPFVQVVDNLAGDFTGVSSINIQGTPVLGGFTAPVTAFDGSANTGLLSGADTLPASTTRTISYVARIDLGAQPGPFNSQASITSAEVLGGFGQLIDLSDSGTDPDPDGDGNPNESSGSGGNSEENEATVVTFDTSPDDDNDGLSNAQEAVLGTNPNDDDSDDDGLEDGLETGNDTSIDAGDTDPLDADTDNDGIGDGTEDANQDGSVSPGETDPNNADSDNDLISDGIEIGITSGVADPDGAGPATGTEGVFVADADPLSTTNPLSQDSDNDGLNDGVEDANQNGSADNPTIGGTGTSGSGETDAANPDTDGDNLTDGNEVNGTGAQGAFGPTDPLDTDTDDGGGTDGDEVANGTNPTAGNGGDDIADADGDGTPDNTDPEPNNPCVPDNNVAACDTDMDGIADGVEEDAGTDPNDPDSDGDGIPDGDEQADSDGDGIPDGAETDSDNDGIPDIVEAGNPTMPTDTDNDGVPDYRDLDSDNDGIPDAEELIGSTPLSGNDGDDDGIDDAIDVDATGGLDANNDGIDDDAYIDTDGDGTPDFQDLDSDADGIPDAIEGNIDTDQDGTPNFRDLDSDSDSIADAVEADSTGADVDGDGIEDQYDPDQTGGLDGDNNRVDDAINPTDTDVDGVPDYLDLDSDNDTLNDVVEAGSADGNDDAIKDDLSLVIQDPVNTDGVDQPDYRDLDSNNDGTNDLPAELAALDANGDGAIDDIGDIDGDGIPDVDDPAPDAFGASNDFDGDGVSNTVDLDNDNDGIPDLVEAPNGDFGLDTDSDGVPDYLDLDSDNDGIADVLEADNGTTDDDGDGRVDGFQDTDNNGLHDPIAESFMPVDTDNNGVADFRSLDSDGDTLLDILEVGLAALDADGDGTIDDATDTNGDGWRDGADPSAGAAGADLVDTDSNGTPNYKDLDSDGDGIPDSEETLDVNGDGILDYLQPGRAVLETATRGSGGAIALWELGLLGATLAALALLRRRSLSAATSTGTLVLVLMAAPALLVSSDAQAGDCAKDRSSPCWYVYGGFGSSHVDPENRDQGFETDDDTDVGWKAGIGWRFKPRWFAELSYADLGDASIININPAVTAATGQADIEYKVPSLMLGFLLLPPAENRINLFLKAGVSAIDNKSTNRRVDFEKQTDVQFALGIGAIFEPQNSRMFMRAAFDSYDRDAWLVGLEVGAYLGGSD